LTLDINQVPVALLAGGLATRLRPVTHKVPKALVSVAGKPFIDHQLSLLARSGIRHVVLCLGYLGEQVRDHVGDGERFGLRVQYSFDGPELRGTGGAVSQAMPLLGEAFWVMYGDSYMEIDYPAVLRAFDQAPDALGLMTVIHNADRWDKSNVIFRDGRLLRYDKKNRTPDMAFIDYGVQLLRREGAMRLPSQGASDLAELYHLLVEQGQMIGYKVNQRFYEIGTPASLAEAEAWLGRRSAIP